MKKCLCFISFVVFFFFWEGAHAASPEKEEASCSDLLIHTLQKALDEATGPSWTPDVQTLKGRLDFLLSILERHPGFVTKNLTYRRNFMEAIDHIPEALKVLGENAASLEIRPSEILSMRYSTEALTFDPRVSADFKKRRIEDLNVFRGKFSLLPGEKDLLTQLKYFKEIDKNREAIQALVRLTPFLFDSYGKFLFKVWDEEAKNSIIQTIEESTPMNWDNLYGDYFKGHVYPLIQDLKKENGFSFLAKFFLRQVESFRDTELKTVFSTQDKGPLEIREISIETLPSAVAVIGRGVFGGDCSILSVPYFALHKDVNVHYIRKSKDLKKDPDGYVFSVNVEVETSAGTKKVPYILTSQGVTLNKRDIEAVTELVLEFYGSSEVVYPDWSLKDKKGKLLNETLVNWRYAQEALTHKDGKKLKIKLPPGWDALDEYHGKMNYSRTSYKNFYEKSRIERAILGKFKPTYEKFGEIERIKSKILSYNIPKKIEEIDLFQRTLLANYAADYYMHRKEILEILSAPGWQVRISNPLIHISGTTGLTVAQYRDLEKTFQFGLKEILAYEDSVREKTLASLYEDHPPLIQEHGGRNNNKIKEALIKHYGGTEFKRVMKKIWDAPDVSDKNLFYVLRKAEGSFNAVEIYASLLILKEVEGTSLERWMENAIVHNIRNIYTDAQLGRALLRMTEENASPHLKKMLPKMLNDLAGIPIIEAYRGVLSEGKLPRDSAAKLWLRESREMIPKAEFLLSQLGRGYDKDFSKKSYFETFLEAVPETQHEDIWSYIDQHTNLRLYQNLAQKKKLPALVFARGKLESFQFKPIITEEQAKNGGVTFIMGQGPSSHRVTLTESYEAMAAPLTQLEVFLITGKNPSSCGSFEALNFKQGFKKPVSIVPSQPVTLVSRKDEDEILNALNKLDPQYHYRRPTEAEWEYAARGGTTTKYYYGSRSTDMRYHGWTRESPNPSSRSVADLRANPYGLHDMYGLVLQRVEDFYEDYSSLAVVNPRGPLKGDHVFRGGCTTDLAWNVHSAKRTRMEFGDRWVSMGVRFVRTLKHR